MAHNILIADDDKSICTVLEHALADFPAQVKITHSAVELQDWVKQGLGDCVLSDVFMDDGNGIEILKEISNHRPDLPVIITSANNTVLTAIDAGKYGAFEYLPKPFDLDELKSILTSALSKSQGVTTEPNMELPIVGKSKKMQSVYRMIGKLLNSDETVIINGESGTGKELVARTLHDFGMRKSKPFVAINMGAIPKDLIETELFGYEKGAFTGADSEKQGKFLQADGGTLFLDEIGDMPMEAQIRLLRVLQESEVSPVGSNKSYKCDVRVISATHKDLKAMIETGHFREDLYYRLNVVKIDLPPLRERLDDIGDLVNYFLGKVKSNKTFSANAIEELQKFNWAGNVRELENFIRQISLLSNQAVIDAVEVNSFSNQSAKTIVDITNTNYELEDIIEKFVADYYNGNISTDKDIYEIFLTKMEKPLIQQSLDHFNGNQIKTADYLGLNRNTLKKKITLLGIKINKKRD